jgi:protein gp37
MGAKTEIQWTDSSWNPTTGCTKVSPGCDHCYAEGIANRFKGTPAYPNGFELTLRPERLAMPLRWKSPRRIFVNSMSDLFHTDVPDGLIAAVWLVMGQCAGLIPERYRGHTFQVLTKRPARMRSWLRMWSDTGDPAIPPMDAAAADCGRARLVAAAAKFMGGEMMYDWMDGPRYWPTVLPNVWLGTSVEDQRWADVRIPVLLDTPAAVRFISAEPLLGPVRLFGDLEKPGPGDVVEAWTIRTDYGTGVEHDAQVNAGLDWVIVGGESGADARPMRLEWATALRDQCVAAGVAFHFKQAGVVLAKEWGAHGKGGDPDEWPESFPREYPQGVPE